MGWADNLFNEARGAVSDVVNGAVNAVAPILANPVGEISKEVSNTGKGIKNLAQNPKGALTEYANNGSYFLDPRNAFTGGLYGLTRAATAAEDRKQEEEDRARQAEDYTNLQRASLAELRDRAARAADEFEASQGSRIDRLNRLAAGRIRSGLLQNQEASNDDFSRRGLLMSGLRVKRRKDLQNEAAGAYGQAANENYDTVRNQLTGMRDTVARLGLNAAGADQSAQESAYRQAIDNMQRQNQAWGQVGDAAGGAVGRYLASQNDKKRYG